MIFVQNCCCSVVLLTDFDWLNGETDEADKVLIEKIGKYYPNSFASIVHCLSLYIITGIIQKRQKMSVHLRIKWSMIIKNCFLTNFHTHNSTTTNIQVIPVRPTNTWLMPLDRQTSGALLTLNVCSFAPVSESMANQLSRLWPTANTRLLCIPSLKIQMSIKCCIGKITLKWVTTQIETLRTIFQGHLC